MIIVIGVAGSGKSTQSQLIAKASGWLWLSMGQLLRNRIVSGELAKTMQSGKLLDDIQVEPVLSEELKSAGNSNIVLDGFPRTTSQVQWLMAETGKLGITIDAIVHLQANNEVVYERLTSRGRSDDIPDAIQERFKEYEIAIKPVIEIFKGNSIEVLDINAEQSPEAVHKDVRAGLDRLGIKL